MSLGKRRESVWFEEEIGDNKENNNEKRARSDHESFPISTIDETNTNTSNEIDSNTRTFGSDANVQPAKVLNRRQSARILARAQKQQEQQQQQEQEQINVQQNTNNATSVIDITQIETVEYIVVDDLTANNHTDTAARHVAPVTRPVTSNYKFKPRCELTIEILKRFDRLDPVSLVNDIGINDTLSAVCLLCGKPRNYVKGNISNLKTHLKRVIY